MVELISVPHAEGKDPPVGQEVAIWNRLIAAGKTAVANGLSPDNVRGFVKEAAEINPTVFNEGTQEHIFLTARYARKFAGLLGIDEDRAEMLALFHDIGRTFTHRKGRNEVVEVALMKKIGLPDDFMDDLYSDELFAPKGVEKMTNWEAAKAIVEGASKITENPYWSAVLMSDLLAKRNKSGSLRRVCDIFSDGHFIDRYKENTKQWPSEKRRFNSSKMAGHKAAINLQTRRMIGWIEKQIGKPIDSVVEEMELELK